LSNFSHAKPGGAVATQGAAEVVAGPGDDAGRTYEEGLQQGVMREKVVK